MEFKNIQQFIIAVSLQSKKVKDFGLKESSLGGFHPPISTIDKLLRLAKEESIVRSRAQVLEPDEVNPDAATPIAVLKQGDDGISGKMNVIWFNQSNEMDELDAEFEEIMAEPQSVGGFATISDKLLNNGASVKYIEQLMKECIIDAEDEKFLVGSGIGCPLGAINCPGKLEVDRNTANLVQYIDITNMIAKLPPESMDNAVFVANQSIVPELLMINDATGQRVFKLGNKEKGTTSSILDLPVRWTDKTPGKGNKGDLMLCDFRYYTIRDGSSLRIMVSNAAGFTKNKSQLRIVWNVDGQGMVAKPLKLKNGNYASPFVVLK